MLARPELLDLVKRNDHIEDSVKIAGRPSCFHFFQSAKEADSYIEGMNNSNGKEKAVPFSSLKRHEVDGGWLCYVANGGAVVLRGIRNLLAAYHETNPNQKMELEVTVVPKPGKKSKSVNEVGAAVEDDAEVNVEDAERDDMPRNWVLFGAPGTGKSYSINQRLNGMSYRRITLYPDYGYAQFVGMYKPVSKTIEKDGKEFSDISYEFVPGPFITTLVDALNESQEKQVLVIEEINRADPASVFGDVFQLLDRNSEGVSEYPVEVSEDLRAYLSKELNVDGKRNLAAALGGSGEEGAKDASSDCHRIVIPSNMYIWATMNSADQGVFPMDTAFKRRWTFEYLDINEGEGELSSGNAAVWNEIRKGINKLLRVNGRDIPEDKLLGPYFLSAADLQDARFEEALKSKVVMYLFEDAAKYCRSAIFDSGLFENGSLYLSDLFEKFNVNLPNLGIFINDVRTAPKDSADENAEAESENAEPDEADESVEQDQSQTEPERN